MYVNQGVYGWIISRCTYKVSVPEIFREPSHVDIMTLTKDCFLWGIARSFITIKTKNHPQLITDARITRYI